MKQNRNLPMTFYTMGIACLFLAGFFLLVFFGAQTYQSTVAGQMENNQSRVLLSYLSTCVKASDRAGAIDVVENGGSQVLRIADGDSGYCFRIYWQDGSLMEEYGQIQEQINPAAARVIGETQCFSIEEVSKDTFAVTTDAGRVLFHIRSKGTENVQEGSGG